METTEETKVTEPVPPSQETQSSAEVTWDANKYPSWQKSIGKEYWGNEKLAKFGSMKEVMESIVNPQKKAPEKYEGISDELADVAEILKDADVCQDDAKKIADVLSKHLPKKYTEEGLKDIYGADYEEADKYFGKAVEKMLSDEKDRKEFNKLKNNPVLFKFAKMVGQNIGDGPTLDIGKEQPSGSDEGDPFMTRLLAKKK